MTNKAETDAAAGAVVDDRGSPSAFDAVANPEMLDWITALKSGSMSIDELAQEMVERAVQDLRD